MDDILQYLDQAVKKHASDLHISPGTQPILRIDGELVPIEDAPILTDQMTKTIASKIMNEQQFETFKKNLELDFAYLAENIGGFRVNAYHELYGIAIAFRAIPSVIPTIESLELPSLFKEFLDLPNGLIIVTGPTGSGKSTTLAAMIDYINTNYAKHIITIEDPIEFIHKSKKSRINQRQLHRDTHSFTVALRAALREDPDVILLGEMRDLDSIRLALTAAETGHLVMTTLHTSSAPRSISRIIDVFSPAEKEIIRNMLSESVRAVITQTLLKKVDGGRIPAFEIMIGVPSVRNLIREGQIAQMYTSMQTGSMHGMSTLDQYLQKMIEKQLITPETARSVATNREMFSF